MLQRLAGYARAQALTLFNPTLTLGRFVNGHEREIERQLSLNLVQLITLPWRSRWQGWQLEQATLTAAQQVLLHAASVGRGRRVHLVRSWWCECAPSSLGVQHVQPLA